MLPPFSQWTGGLTKDQVRLILDAELRYSVRLYRYLPSTHPKGYPRVWLPPGHPYAVAGGRRRRRPGFGGWQYLHRYLMMRHEGRVLSRHEHVHHVNGRKDSADVHELQVMEEADHGRYHYGEWISCGPHLQPCSPCEGDGCGSCGGAAVVAV